MVDRIEKLEARISAIEEELAAQEAMATEQLERLRNPQMVINEPVIQMDIEAGSGYFKGDITVDGSERPPE